MNIVILTVGSRGDIQPFVVLGVGLQRVGHHVTLCTSENFADFVTGHGLRYAYMNDDLIRLTETGAGKAAVEGQGNRLNLLKMVKPILRRMLAEAWTAAQGAEAIIYHPKALAGYHLAEKLAIPGFVSLSLPMLTPTRAFSNPVLPALRLGGAANWLSYKITDLISAPYMGIINQWRRETLGLPPRPRFSSEMVRADGRPVPVLYSFSEHVVPRPADWPAWVQPTGYWFLDEADGWRPSPELVDFLAAGPPPIYIGFGSMAGQQPERLGRIALDALAQTGQRGLLATGWGGLAATGLPDTVFQLTAAPHDWLFPQVAAVVHHGGAGTTAAGLRAGRPTVICPFIADQPFWGRRVAELGAGPRPITQKQLTADGLAQAIQTAVMNTAMRQRAADLGEKLRAEDGVARAVSIIHQTVAAYAGAPLQE
jgi:sterol 3beta-glucosyltransferase